MSKTRAGLINRSRRAAGVTSRPVPQEIDRRGWPQPPRIPAANRRRRSALPQSRNGHTGNRVAGLPISESRKVKAT